jgi:hypothetical protein
MLISNSGYIYRVSKKQLKDILIAISRDDDFKLPEPVGSVEVNLTDMDKVRASACLEQMFARKKRQRGLTTPKKIA